MKKMQRNLQIKTAKTKGLFLEYILNVDEQQKTIEISGKFIFRTKMHSTELLKELLEEILPENLQRIYEVEEPSYEWWFDKFRPVYYFKISENFE